MRLLPTTAIAEEISDASHRRVARENVVLPVNAHALNRTVVSNRGVVQVVPELELSSVRLRSAAPSSMTATSSSVDCAKTFPTQGKKDAINRNLEAPTPKPLSFTNLSIVASPFNLPPEHLVLRNRAIQRNRWNHKNGSKSSCC